jgi:phosphohistidine phosphatase SixA
MRIDQEVIVNKQFPSRSIAGWMLGLLLSILVCTDATHAAVPDGAALLAALQKGGQVIVMRHASSPREVPDKASANADNTVPERQLDEVGRNTAVAIGKALRELHIPIGAVLSSPTYRALETIKLAQLPAPRVYPELGDGGHSMQSVGVPEGQWLQQQAAKTPEAGNTLIVTHYPNINAAFPQYVTGLADGEALVFGSDGSKGARLLARVKIEDWPTLGK